MHIIIMMIMIMILYYLQVYNMLLDYLGPVNTRSNFIEF